ncbi:MAG: O-antigen ligase family protein, partial [Verrucomicrobiaceae bacterium]
LGVGSLVLALMVLAILRRAHPHLVMKAALGLVLAGGLAAVVLGAVMNERLQSRFGGDIIPQGDPRLFVWRSALAQHAEHPWFGAGARMFYEGCVRLRPEDAPSWMQDAQFTHNEWLQILSDYGWVGLMLAVIVFAVHLGNGWRYLNWFAMERFPRTATLSGTRLGLAVGSMAALVSALVHAIFEFHFHVPAVALTASVLLGILANPGFEGHAWRPRRVPAVRALSKLTMLGCGLALIWGAWTIGRSDFFVEKSRIRGVMDETEGGRAAWLDRAIALDPANAQSWHTRGLERLEQAAGKPMKTGSKMLEDAVLDLEQSRKLNPYDPFPAMALADALDALGRHAEAEKSILDACREAPLYQQPRVSLAIHLNRLKKWNEAEEAYLWASEASAGRYSDEWLEMYHQMLRAAQQAPSHP